MTIAQVADAIKKEEKHSRKPILIAMEGFGGADKTTLAKGLSKALGSSYVVNIDDFIIKDKLFDSSPDKPGFDRTRLERQILGPISKGQPVAYQELIWETNHLSEFKAIPKVDHAIVEGISSYYPDIAHYYDYKIWVDINIKIANARGKLRDAGNENEDKWDSWAETDLVYQQKYHPKQVADFVIEN